MKQRKPGLERPLEDCCRFSSGVFGKIFSAHTWDSGSQNPAIKVLDLFTKANSENATCEMVTIGLFSGGSRARRSTALLITWKESRKDFLQLFIDDHPVILPKLTATDRTRADVGTKRALQAILQRIRLLLQTIYFQSFVCFLLAICY